MALTWVDWFIVAFMAADVLFMIRATRVCWYRTLVLMDETRDVDEALTRYYRLPDHLTMMIQLHRWSWDDYLVEESVKEHPPESRGAPPL